MLLKTIFDYFITHPTFDFNQGTFWDYAYYADGWSLDEDEGYIVSEANYTNEWGGAYVEFPIKLGGQQVSFRAKALGVNDAETYTVRIWDTYRDEVITLTLDQLVKNPTKALIESMPLSSVNA